MANPTMALIASNTVGSSGSASVTFSSIPATYTDLIVYVSARDTSSAVGQTLAMRLNGDSTTGNYSWIRLEGNGATASSGSGLSDNALVAGATVGSTATANTFDSSYIYISNYLSANYKSMSFDTVSENNATTAYADLNAGLWKTTNPITSITLYGTSGNFVQYSTFYLYGIKNS